MFNDEFLVFLFGLVPARHGNILFSECAHDLPLAWLQSVHILKIYISQGSVATCLTCGELQWSLYCKFPRESADEKKIKIDQYLVKIWTGTWCLPYLTRDVSVLKPNMGHISEVAAELRRYALQYGGYDLEFWPWPFNSCQQPCCSSVVSKWTVIAFNSARCPTVRKFAKISWASLRDFLVIQSDSVNNINCQGLSDDVTGRQGALASSL